MVGLAAERFVAFGPAHWLILGLFAAGCVAALLLGLRLPDAKQLWFRRAAGVAVLLLCGPFEVSYWVHGVQFWRTSLPLQLCDFTWLVAGVALLTGSRAWSAVLYYWGLTLTVQAVLTPDLDVVFPQWSFFGYWVRHILPVWAAVYLVGARVGTSWRGYRITMGVTVLWAACVMTLNSLVGSNYGFLNAKPLAPSILDLLGPWPWYVVVEGVLVTGVWALITWPWTRRRRHDPS